MSGPQLKTNAQIPSVFNIDPVTITRQPGGPNPSVTTIWTGTADLQETRGDIFYDPAGAVEEIDATLIIDENAAPSLPSVEVDDIVASADGRTWRVAYVGVMTFVYPYLRLLLKRGPLRAEQK